jgi:broad specificity phosphatase PhoE
MDIYFVRHGQTDGNVALRHQHVNTSLNELGKLQARMVAKKIAKIKPTNVVSSTNLRAIETTKIIVDECGRIPPKPTLPLRSLEDLTGSLVGGL